ncbi:MAG: diaminopimelate epimerase [Pseudomonadota bacterium]
MIRPVENQPRALPFRKSHGLGNDFVLLDQRDAPVALTPDLVRAIGDRHRGVGFDQLAEIYADDDADARLVFWNADGSQAGACGNATRCIADLLMNGSAGPIGLRTQHGMLSARRRQDGMVEVDMGPALTGWAEVPLARETDTAHLPLPGDPAACSMGNPHCTFFVDDADAVDLAEIGARTEHDPLFPERTNVQVVQVLETTRARVRVWERGVGRTLASGSSACAVLVNGRRRGLLDRAATLELDGGEIHVTLHDDGHVLMAGPVAHVFEAALSPEWVEAHR